MREFKFRAWDKVDNKMYYDAEKTYDFIGNDIMEESFGSLLDSDNFIVMQYTGLIDKNRKEIYEGDLVKTTEYIGIVEYYKGMYCINVDDSFKLPMYDTNEFMEVIGNIYETPDLLK